MSAAIEFPHTLVINLEERQDRWAHISQACDAAGIQVERVAAIKATPGWVGCGKSHLECLRRAAQRGLPWVLVLEDDALFTPADIDRFRALLPHLWELRDNWDIFNGGPTLTSSKPELRILNKEGKLVLIQGLCSHFMLYQQTAYALVEQWNSASDGPFDGFLYKNGFGHDATIRTVATTPGIATQLLSISSIYGTTNDQTGAFQFANQRLLGLLCEQDWISNTLTCEAVDAVHRSWRGQILLERHGAAALLPLAQLRADYSKAPGVLVIRWHYSPAEIFVEVGGEFVLAGYLLEYLKEKSQQTPNKKLSVFETIHPHWSDQLCLLHELKRVIKLSDGGAGSYKKTGSTLEIQWDTYPKEFFLRTGDRYEFSAKHKNDTEPSGKPECTAISQSNACNAELGIQSSSTNGTNSIAILLARFPQKQRDFLLFIRAGSKPRPSFYSQVTETRNFDIIINYYSTPNPEDEMFSAAEGVVFGGLSKFHAMQKLALEKPEVKSYKGIQFIDDDLEFLFQQDKFFEMCVSQSFDLAQPSLTHDSYSSFKITLHHPGLSFRHTNYVEVMAPYFSQEFFLEMLPTFHWSISTWGLDVYWGSIIGDKWRASIVDEFQIRHIKPIDSNGPFYQYLKSIGVDPNFEMRCILDHLGIDTYVIKPTQFIFRSDVAWSSAHEELYNKHTYESLDKILIQFETCNLVSFDIADIPSEKEDAAALLIQALQAAHQSGKRVIALGNLDAQRPFVQNALETHGLLCHVDMLYLASEHKAITNLEKLWDLVFESEKCPQNCWIHLVIGKSFDTVHAPGYKIKVCQVLSLNHSENKQAGCLI